MKQLFTCDWCGKAFERWPTKARHHFCSRACLAAFSSKSKNPEGYQGLKDYAGIKANMAKINRRLNPERMTPAIREKVRAARLNSGAGRSYGKIFGKPEHRVVMESVLGRELLPGEVVHHIDGNKRNNAPENLMLFASQAEHVRWHKKAGDLK